MSAPVTETQADFDASFDSEAPVETAAAVETEKVETEVVDLSAFKDAVENVISDPADVSEEDTKAAQHEYRELSRKGKAGARSYVEDQTANAVLAGNLGQAQALLALADALRNSGTKTSGPSAPRKPKNPTDSYVEHVAQIQLAYSLSVLNAPENLDEDWKERVQAKCDADAQTRAQAYRAFVEAKQEGDEPEATESEKAGARISLGRAPKGQGRKPKGVEEAEKAAAAAAENQDAIPGVDPENEAVAV
jgi:hypothetical protein